MNRTGLLIGSMITAGIMACKSKVHNLATPPDPGGMGQASGLSLTEADRKSLAISLKREIELYLYEPTDLSLHAVDEDQRQEFSNFRSLAEFVLTLPLDHIVGYALDLKEHTSSGESVTGERGNLISQAGLLVTLGLYGIAYSRLNRQTRKEILAQTVMPLLNSGSLHILSDKYGFQEGSSFELAELISGAAETVRVQGSSKKLTFLRGLSLALIGAVTEWPVSPEAEELNEITLLRKLSQTIRELSDSFR